MARKIVNIGSQGNDGTGDSLRESFKKINENFRELYSVFGVGDAIRFSDLADGPASYADGQVFVAGKTTPSSPSATVQAKTLTAGDGVNITSTPTSIIIGTSSGLNSLRPTLTAGLNAAGFGIANALQPDDTGIDNKITAWNLLHGTGITASDLLINRRYADGRYAPLESSRPLMLRAASSGAEFVKTITNYLSGNVVIPSHGFTSTDNGKGYRFTTTGSLPASSPAIQNNGLYYIRVVSPDSVSLHLSKTGAETNTGRIIINAAGDGTARLIHESFDQTLPGGWLSSEAVPRSAVVLRSGDTMTGPLTLSGAPTLDLHAASKQYVDTRITQSGLTSTDQLPENSVNPQNLYFRSERARAAISASSISGAGGSLTYNATTGAFTYTAITSDQIRQLLSASTTADSLGNLTYNIATGTFTYTGPTVAEVRALFSATKVSGAGSIMYNLSTGVLTYTGPSAAEVRAHFSAGTGVSITEGTIAIGQAVSTTSNVTFGSVTTGTVTANTLNGTISTAHQPNITSLGLISSLETSGDLRVGGNLIVEGTTTTVDTKTVVIEDPIITVGSNTDPGVPDGKHRGLEFKWPDAGFVKTGFIGFNTDTKKFTLISDAINSSEVMSGTPGTLVANLEGTVSTLSNHTTAALAEGSNLYFRTDRARNAISVANEGTFGSIAYNSTSGTITYRSPSTAQILNIFAAGNGVSLVPPVADGEPLTIQVNPGVVMTWDEFDTINDNVNSDDVIEGTTNLFFTVDRARAAFTAGNDVTISSGTVSIVSSVPPTTNSIVKRSAVGGISGAHVSGSAVTKVLLANQTLNLSEMSSNIFRIDMTGPRNLTLPLPADANGQWLIIRNISGTFTLTIISNGSTVTTINAGDATRVACDGVDWFVF